MKSTYGFSRRTPDIVAHEIATVLSTTRWFEFKELFDVVHRNLKARNVANCGEEMLRLRTYEKLQNLVSAGAVKKNSKKYQGIALGLEDFFETAAAMKVDFTKGTKCRTPVTANALAV
ncbi:hypothetical protein ACXR0O_28290 [Verrucomicrobiota bacterium sgz303538]